MNSKAGAITINEKVKQRLEQIKAVENLLPLVIIIINIKDSSVVYMSEMGRKLLNISMDALSKMGSSYHSRFFNVEESKDYVPKILELLERNNNDEMISFFQQVRPSAKDDWTWYLSATKIFMRDDEGQPLLTITTATPVEKKHYLASKIERLLQENNMLRRNKKVFALLTKREKSVLTLMALGKNSSEIAQKLHISENTAATHRRNIKKKLNAQTNYDITIFAQAFDLI